jgi:hypothetical protein
VLVVEAVLGDRIEGHVSGAGQPEDPQPVEVEDVEVNLGDAGEGEEDAGRPGEAARVPGEPPEQAVPAEAVTTSIRTAMPAA